MQANGFFETLANTIELSDPRVDRGENHCLKDKVALTICGTICGADSWVSIERFARTNETWFRRFLPLENGIPSHDTFGRVFARLDTAQFYDCVLNWISKLNLSLSGCAINIDGKALRGSHDRSEDQKPLHIVSAWANELKFCIGQRAVDSKSNEIPAVQELLDMLQLEGAVVTIDAMHCQKQTLRKIEVRGADYVVQVKGNQKNLHKRLRDEVDGWAAKNFELRRLRTHSKTERSHGREETRTCMVHPAPVDLKKQWPGLQTIGIILRERILPNGKQTSESTVFISSLPAKVGRHVELLRKHWGVENELHHTLDVTFREDSSRTRKGSSPQVSGGFRRTALSILTSDTSIDDNVRGKRQLAGWNLSNLEKILAGFQDKLAA